MDRNRSSEVLHHEEALPLQPSGGIGNKLSHWKRSAKDSLHSVESRASHGVTDKVDDVRRSVRAMTGRLDHSMRSSPMKWAGIAAGTGFGLGLLGRMMRREKRVPDLIIIEAI